MAKKENGQVWSVEEDAILADMWPKGYTTTQIAERLPLRTPDSVAARARKLELPKRDPAAFYRKRREEAIPENAAEIVAKHVAGMTASQIGLEIGKTRDWVLNLIKMLRHHGWDIPTMKGRKTTEKVVVETYCDHVFYIVKPGGRRFRVSREEIFRRAA